MNNLNKFLDIIVCVDNKNGIAKNGKIPWNIPDDMNYFKTKTTQTEFPYQKNIVIMGKNTFNEIKKPLKDRINIVLTSAADLNSYLIDEDIINYFQSLNSALQTIYSSTSLNFNKIFIIGGEKLYNEALQHPYLRYVYINFLDEDYQCDKFFHLPSHFECDNEKRAFFVQQKPDMQSFTITKSFTIAKYSAPKNGEIDYLNLCQKILSTGELRQTRNAKVLSLFGKTLTFDLKNSFPLLTTKKMALRIIFEELMFFLRGQTDVGILKKKNVNIWNANTTKEFIEKQNLPYEENDLGPMYGFNFRHFGEEYKNCKTEYKGGFDQLQYVINLLKTDPYSRRIIMTSYNPQTASQGVLHCCHGLTIQFYVNEQKELSCSVTCRSQDVLLGTPFNIASYALLVYLLANYLELKLGTLTMFLGDVHIYEDHVDAVKTQLMRIPKNFPKLHIKKKKDKIEDYEFEDLLLKNYDPYDTIFAKMIA